MSEELAMYIAKRALELSLMLMAPVLIVTLVIGFATALLQAVTSLRDQTMGMVLKLAAIGLTLVFAGAWMIQTTVGFTRETFNLLQSLTK